MTGSPATIVKGNEAAAVTVTVTNSISHDQGYLKIGKVFDAKSSGFVGSFTVKYKLRCRRSVGAELRLARWPVEARRPVAAPRTFGLDAAAP